MKRQSFLLATLLLAVVGAVHVRPALADNGCPVSQTVAQGTAPNGFVLTPNYPVKVNESVAVTLTATDYSDLVYGDTYNTSTGYNPFAIGQGNVNAVFPAQGARQYNSIAQSRLGGSISYSVAVITPNGCVTHYTATDGRVNPNDAQQTNTACCGRNGSLNVFKVVNSRGVYLFTVSRQAITDGTARAKQIGKPILLGEKGSVQLWALPSNELQLQDAKGGANPYHDVFAATLCS